ncbi:unnamed protein product [Ceutorhynchus assimilis]|uniref:Protein-tyrosine sulfotransferase n=1 Tax=Ceutorhynchus assimilis TaxID=467358 RepID=A0A9P0DFQ8_9CUCU|nr:unnamed protein product [Ceutorhynchus assimilis]
MQTKKKIRAGPQKVIAAFCLLVILYFVIQTFILDTRQPSMHKKQYVVNNQTYNYNRQMPLIFIGGVPRSGTTLIGAMLDAHQDIRCGQETRVIPRLLQMRANWMKSEKESKRLIEAGVGGEVLNSEIAAFMLEIIVKHGELAPRLCNKDPLIMKMGKYVADLFPEAKFIFMVRDGRATVHSIISRKVGITGFNLTNYKQCMEEWNRVIDAMNTQCQEIGQKCLRVQYEQLVLHPRKVMSNILQFLDVPWDESGLHHEDFINKGVKVSKLEPSSDQIIKPINMEALSKWTSYFPENVLKEMANIAPMLSVLGYDPYANSPNYGQPDVEVVKNTQDVQGNKSLWNKIAKELRRSFRIWTTQLLKQCPAKVRICPKNIRFFSSLNCGFPFSILCVVKSWAKLGGARRV